MSVDDDGDDGVGGDNGNGVDENVEHTDTRSTFGPGTKSQVKEKVVVYCANTYTVLHTGTSIHTDVEMTPSAFEENAVKLGSSSNSSLHSHKEK